MATLRVRDRGAGPIIYGRRRHAGRNVERPIGRGWLVAADEPGAKPNDRTIGAWRERRGRPDATTSRSRPRSRSSANVEERWEAETARETVRRGRAERECATLEQAAERFLAWGAHDDPHTDREGWKHSYAQNTRRYVGRCVRGLGAERRIDEARNFHVGAAPVGRPLRSGTSAARKRTRSPCVSRTTRCR